MPPPSHAPTTPTAPTAPTAPTTPTNHQQGRELGLKKVLDSVELLTTLALIGAGGKGGGGGGGGGDGGEGDEEASTEAPQAPQAGPKIPQAPPRAGSTLKHRKVTHDLHTVQSKEDVVGERLVVWSTDPGQARGQGRKATAVKYDASTGRHTIRCSFHRADQRYHRNQPTNQNQAANQPTRPTNASILLLARPQV